MSTRKTMFEADLKLRLQELAVGFIHTLESVRPAHQDAHVPSVLFTSARPGEGKTTLAVQIAQLMAHASGEPVLLVDANFQSPELSRLYGLGEQVGFSDLLLGAHTLPDAATRATQGVTVLGAGRSLDAVILSRTAAYERVRAAWQGKFRYVVFDGAIARLGGSMLAKQVDKVAVVIDSTETRREVVQGAIGAMGLREGQMLGCILNKRMRYIPNFLYKAL